MKPAQKPQAAQEASVRVEFQIQFAGGPKGRRRSHEEAIEPAVGREAPTAEASVPEPTEEVSFGRLPKVTKLLVLGHYFEKLVKKGMVKDYAEIARLTGLSRARVTQITNLTLLAPSIQEDLLTLPPRYATGKTLAEHEMRLLGASVDREEQQLVWTLFWPVDPDSALR